MDFNTFQAIRFLTCWYLIKYFPKKDGVPVLFVHIGGIEFYICDLLHSFRFRWIFQEFCSTKVVPSSSVSLGDR